jgi:hypothetical protein
MNRRLNNRGFILISSYLVLSLFLVYSNAMTMRTIAQRMASDRLRDRFQALDLAQGSVEQLREDLHYFLTTIVYQQLHQGNAVAALQWLDNLGTQSEVPTFDIPLGDRNGDGQITFADGDENRDGIGTNPRCVTGLPTIKDATCAPTTRSVQAPRARIVSITNPGEDLNGNGILDIGEDTNTNGVLDPPGPLTPRLVTLEAEAQAGSVAKRIRATYAVELGVSDIFRYAYFVNNYGWFNVTGGSSVLINGEVRANGDLAFTGNLSQLRVHGDLFASKNPELVNPKTLSPTTGTISGDPNQWSGMNAYWKSKSSRARPTRKLTFTPGQPAIGDPNNPKILPAGQGWDTQHPKAPDQQKSPPGQPTQDIPYLGDLSLYKTVATQTGSHLTYHVGGKKQTVNAVYNGPDGKAGTADDSEPLVLVGTSSKPIVIDGPVVIPGDVIIKGVVTGRGTIYAGRNVHVVGDVTYKQSPSWDSLERNSDTGEIRRKGGGPNLGSVCNDGTYVAPDDGEGC